MCVCVCEGDQLCYTCVDSLSIFVQLIGRRRTHTVIGHSGRYNLIFLYLLHTVSAFFPFHSCTYQSDTAPQSLASWCDEV